MTQALAGSPGWRMPALPASTGAAGRLRPDAGRARPAVALLVLALHLVSFHLLMLTGQASVSAPSAMAAIQVSLLRAGAAAAGGVEAPQPVEQAPAQAVAKQAVVPPRPDPVRQKAPPVRSERPRPVEATSAEVAVAQPASVTESVAVNAPAAAQGGGAVGAPTAAAAGGGSPAASASAEQGGGADTVVPPSFEADYLSNPAPQYPRVSRELGERGRAFLRVHVSAAGQPLEVLLHQSSGFARLDAAAIAAVRQWRFVPARRAGSAIADWVVVPVNFTLRR